MERDTSLTDNQTEQNQAGKTDPSATDDQTKLNQTDSGDTSITGSQSKPTETNATDISAADDQIKTNQTNAADSSSVGDQTKPSQSDTIDTSFTDIDLKPEKIDVKEEGPKFHCELSDKEMVHKIALALLEGLSTACVDMTTGDIFRSPGTVVADVRKEMLGYLTERSQSFVAETVVLDGGPQEEKSDHPFDIISDFIDDFLALKRNLLSRVSGWLLSDMREDKIDDFVQEMELNSFWLLDRREAVAQTLLRNVDFKSEFHCNKMFKTNEELEQHRLECGFRTVMCENEGCSATFSAAQMQEHDSICPFKILPCEQKCPEILMRREMDRHCITVCPMKLVNCPFYSIGCQATVPSCNIREHCSNDVRCHLLYALQYLHKGASAEDLGPRVEQIEEESSGRLAGMQGVRTFTNAVKDIDSRLGPFKVEKKRVDNAEDVKPLDSNEQPADKEKEAKTSDSSEHPEGEEKDTETSDSGDGPPDKGKDVETSDSGEPPAHKENDAGLLESGKHPTEKETDTKPSYSSEHPVDTERGMSNSEEHRADKQKDQNTSEISDHNATDMKISDLGQHTEDNEKNAKAPNSGKHPVDKEKDTRSLNSAEQSTEKLEDVKTSDSGSGEHSTEQNGN